MHNMYILKLLLSQKDFICADLYLYVHWISAAMRGHSASYKLISHKQKTTSIIIVFFLE
jgi:hypothetical protein